MPCDTFVVLPDCSASEQVLFAKNSDRPPNEPQVLDQQTRLTHAANTTVKCTYISIPQVRETARCLLCRPLWCWGAEMGVNEYGVAIGNEAIYAKSQPSLAPNFLIGMDLVRLGLERGRTAEQALSIMTTLLETHGQGGSGYATSRESYHNSFLIADASEAWVLETVGKLWAAQRVTSGYRVISNGLTIHNKFDRCSVNLVEQAVASKLCKSKEDFSFARIYTDKLHAVFDSNVPRRCRIEKLLGDAAGAGSGIGESELFSVLKDHNVCGGKPDGHVTGQNVCMHAGIPVFRPCNTTGSLVVRLGPEPLWNTIWVTGTSTPCLSTFKPVWLAAAECFGPWPLPQYDDGRSLWWKHEVLVRLALLDHSRTSAQVAKVFGPVQELSTNRGDRGSDLIAMKLESKHADLDSLAQELRTVSLACFRDEDRARNELISKLSGTRQPILAWFTHILFAVFWFFQCHTAKMMDVVPQWGRATGTAVTIYAFLLWLACNAVGFWSLEWCNVLKYSAFTLFIIGVVLGRVEQPARAVQRKAFEDLLQSVKFN